MKIGIVQLNIEWEDKSCNMKKCEAFFKEASEQGCELVIFPELTLTGFTMNVSLAESVDDSVSIAFFSSCCRRYSVDSIFGFCESSDNSFYNTLLHINKKGEVTARYRKMHPFSYGGEIYTAGNECSSCSVSGEEIGLSICYDLRFPELYQQLSKTCRCIVVSANWPERRIEHWKTLLKARAIENQCFIIGCNRIGFHDVNYTGESMAVSPDGEIVAAADYSTEQLFCFTADLSEADHIRSRFPLKFDRRMDLYRNFYE